MKILIDNGHGINTPGKCSPDGVHKEWAWSREIAQMIIEELSSKGYDAQRIVTENEDVSLNERVRRVNTICRTYGAQNVLLVSIHNNAAGDGSQWNDATGFSVYVSNNSSKNSQELARTIYIEAARNGLKGNRSVPVGKYWTQNLAICRDTLCPACLTENLFQDNKWDVTYLQSYIGKRCIVDVHVQGIINYINKVKL